MALHRRPRTTASNYCYVGIGLQTELQDLSYNVGTGHVAARDPYELCDGLDGRVWLDRLLPVYGNHRMQSAISLGVVAHHLALRLVLQPLLWREGYIILDEDMPAKGKVVEGIVLALFHNALVGLLQLRLCLVRQLHDEEVNDGVPTVDQALSDPICNL